LSDPSRHAGDGALRTPVTSDASLSVRVHRALSEVPRAAWDALLDEEATPFLEWAWLASLEEAGCASPRAGWSARHLALYRRGPGGERLVAAAPAWVRDDSDGDFSRDWGWAEGAARAGIAYYPKLLLGVPFTPATGRRFLVAPGEERIACVAALLDAARALATEERLSSLQVLFPGRDETAELSALGLALRVSYQYQWRNEGYASFDDFLARFDSKKRNQIRRERRAPAEQGIAIRTVRGDELARDPGRWAACVHELHRATVEKLPWGRGWLNRAFYERVLERMPGRLEVVEARRGGDLVAMAFNVASARRLYGRYWGCREEYPFLHFNVCLYHSIEECIRRGLGAFEGGAGGEHKMARGFEPAETYSAHLFLDARMDAAVRRHIQSENRTLAASLAEWRRQSPILKRPAGAARP
jgi:predicted N-acyltransferase